MYVTIVSHHFQTRRNRCRCPEAAVVPPTALAAHSYCPVVDSPPSVFIFLNDWHMNSLIINKIKINMCLISTKFFIGHSILCAIIQTCTTYTAYNLWYTTIIICSLIYVSIFLRKNGNLYNWDCSLHMQRVFIQNWLNLTNHDCLIFLAFLYAHEHYDQHSWSWMFVFSPSRVPFILMVFVFCRSRSSF